MTTLSATVVRLVSELLAEAAEWRLLGLLFSCPQHDWRKHVAALAAEVHDERLQQAARAAVEDGRESVYHTAFGPGGPAAPREISHRQSALTGQYLAELLACYDAFAYSPPRDEPPDHIATEMDFVAYLRLKQAFAMARNNDEKAAITADAAHSFIEDHLVTTAMPLIRALASSGVRYLSLSAAALSEHIGAPRATHNSASSKFAQLNNPALPICDTGDCCAGFPD
jgi:nitrate reductase assembly molybdenum cofactor insertion protein NarJ